MAGLKKSVGLLLIGILLTIGIAVLFLPWQKSRIATWWNRQATVGHTGDPILATLYAAAKNPDWSKEFNLAKFNTSADVGYALLSGEIDAGFIAPSKVAAIQKLPGFKKLDVVGKVVFPYGATLIVRKGLNLRLSELQGLRIGASSKSCTLLHAFKRDIVRFGVKPDSLKYKYLPFDTMIPALEAGIIDGAVIKGSYAAIALKSGHSILYQKWDVEAGDACCPAIIAQLEYLLLVRSSAGPTGGRLVQTLQRLEKQDPSRLRAAVSDATHIPANVLSELPLATFEPADRELLKLFGKHAHEEGDEKHDK